MMQNKHIVTQKFCVTERKIEKSVKEQVIILVGPNKRDIAERQCLSFLFDGQPHSLAPTLGLDDFLFQAVNPDATVEHFADFAVLANEDAAFGVFRAVAGMDTPAQPNLRTSS